MKDKCSLDDSDKTAVTIQRKDSISPKDISSLGYSKNPHQNKTINREFNTKVENYYKDRNFAYAKSKNIVTVWIENTQFSYLNSPSDTEELKFVYRNKENLFVCPDYLANNYPESVDFFREINELTENGALFIQVEKETEKIRSTQLVRRLIFACLAAVLVGTGLVLFEFGREIEPLILLFLGICTMLGIIWDVFLKIENAQLQFFKELSVSYSLGFSVHEVIYRWNKEYFIPNNLELSSVWSLSYVQINFDPLTSHEIEPIPYPF